MTEQAKLTAGDVMTRDVAVIARHTPVYQAARLMTDRRVSGLVVVDEAGKPVGMVTEGDLLRRVETGTEDRTPGWLTALFAPGRLAAQYIRSHARIVAAVMTPEVESVREATPIEEVAALMQRKRFRRVPVLRDGRLVGIVSRRDLVRLLADVLNPAAASADDATIRERLIEEMKRETWTRRRGVTVAVEGGTVLLDGCVFDIRERDALRVMAENIPGVRGVENRLVCVEPNTGVLVFDPYAQTERREP